MPDTTSSPGRRAVRRSTHRAPSDQGNIKPRSTAPGDATRPAGGDRSDDASRAGVARAERHGLRWRDIEWVDFEEPAPPPAPARAPQPAPEPAIRPAPGLGDVLRRFAEPASGRSNDVIPGLTPRYRRLPVEWTVSPQLAPPPAAQHSPPPAAPDDAPPGPPAAEAAVTVHPRVPEPSVVPPAEPAAPGPPPIREPATPEPAEPLLAIPAERDDFPAALSTPVAVEAEPRAPSPPLAATLAARYGQTAAALRRRRIALAAAANAAAAQARAALAAPRAARVPTPAAAPEAVKPPPPFATPAAAEATPAPSPSAEPSRLAALAARARVTLLRLAGDDPRRLKMWLTAGATALAVALAAYAGGAMLAGLFGTGPVRPRAASPRPPQSVQTTLPAQPSPQQQPEAQPGQTADALPSDPAARAALYLTRAKAGDPAAQYDVGVFYARGDGVVQDFASAVSWFRAAAVQGNTRAEYNLGVLYDRGLGVPQSATEAINWYRSAADQNHSGAQYNLAVALANGRGTEQDLAAAARWYQRAAQQGLPQAMVNLAILYESGKGVDRSPIDAYAWYRTAAERRDAGAKDRASELFRQFSDQDKARAEGLAATIAAAVNGAPPA